MESWASSPAVRRSMQSNRPRNTAPEVALRSALHRAGLRFFKHRRPVAALRCEADIIFPGSRVAVFIDGCFWHGCPQHGTFPKTNAEWWAAKLEATRTRDLKNERALTAAGWTVLRVWEHESTADAVARIRASVSSADRVRGATGPAGPVPESLARSADEGMIVRSRTVRLATPCEKR
jgi:DNA mismatch endonuclease (patch repair protein)